MSGSKAPSRAKALRDQAEAIEAVEALLPGFLAAKEAAQANPKDKKLQAAYNRAAEKYAAARTRSREVAVVDTTGGGATIVPNSIGGRR